MRLLVRGTIGLSEAEVEAAVAGSAAKLLAALDSAVRRRVEKATAPLPIPVYAATTSASGSSLPAPALLGAEVAGGCPDEDEVQAECALCHDQMVYKPSAMHHFGSWCGTAHHDHTS
jgi:hypothetical protein